MENNTLVLERRVRSKEEQTTVPAVVVESLERQLVDKSTGSAFYRGRAALNHDGRVNFIAYMRGWDDYQKSFMPAAGPHEAIITVLSPYGISDTEVTLAENALTAYFQSLMPSRAS